MEEKQFEIEDTTYTVSVSHFQAQVPGKFSGDPEDSCPGEPAEIEFEDKVEYAKDGDLEVSTMDFDDFLKLYALDNTGGDTEMALARIESETITEIMIAAGEYEP